MADDLVAGLVEPPAIHVFKIFLPPAMLLPALLDTQRTPL